MNAHESDHGQREHTHWLSHRVLFWSISIFIICVLLSLLLPKPGGGPASRRSQSKNNLKQIVLGVQNYADAAEGKLPRSALLGPEGKEYFGWVVSQLPYLEAAQVYDSLDFDKPWNDPVNRAPASVKVEILLNPRLDAPTMESGYALSHYAANSQVFHTDKAWSFDEISAKDGLQNTILFGEIGNHFQPWAEPGNLRDPAKGLGDGPDQFGLTDNLTVNFALADGSVRAVNPDIDPKILKALATPDGGETIEGDGY